MKGLDTLLKAIPRRSHETGNQGVQQPKDSMDPDIGIGRASSDLLSGKSHQAVRAGTRTPANASSSGRRTVCVVQGPLGAEGRAEPAAGSRRLDGEPRGLLSAANVWPTARLRDWPQRTLGKKSPEPCPRGASGPRKVSTRRATRLAATAAPRAHCRFRAAQGCVSQKLHRAPRVAGGGHLCLPGNGGAWKSGPMPTL